MISSLVPLVKEHASFKCAPSGASSRVVSIERFLTKIIAIEFLVIAGMCYLTSVVYYRAVLQQWPPTPEYVLTAFLIAILVLLSAVSFKQFTAIQAQPPERYMWSGMGAVTLAFSLFLSILFVFKIADWYSRGTFFCQFLGVSVAMLMTRKALFWYIRHSVKSGTVEARRALFVGNVNIHNDILDNLRRFGIRFASIVSPQTHNSTKAGLGAASSSYCEFIEQCREFKPDDIVFLAAPVELPWIAALVDALAELPVAVHVIPTGVNELWNSAKIGNLGETLTLQLLRPPLSRSDLAVKRAFDLCVAGLGLIVLSPLLFIIALAIKAESRGPAIFRQNRQGYNNQVIPVMKFRSMTIVEDGETEKTFTQAKANDPRLTRLGRILRRSNLDELPQLLNVLRGEMSIVGPRPHPIALNTKFRERIAPFSQRHKVKPGLTGWAQVHGFRGETDTIEKMQRRVEHDLYYIDNWSLKLDMKVILMTLLSSTTYRNAY